MTESTSEVTQIEDNFGENKYLIKTTHHFLAFIRQKYVNRQDRRTAYLKTESILCIPDKLGLRQ
jgi:hypothetical protein